MKPVPVPLFRLWLVVFAISLTTWSVLWSAAFAALESKTTFLQVLLFEGLLGGIAIGVFTASFAAWISRPALITVDAGALPVAPRIHAAAQRIRYSVEYLETGEYVLTQRRRGLLGARPTIVISPQSATTLQLAGPRAAIEKLQELLDRPL